MVYYCRLQLPDARSEHVHQRVSTGVNKRVPKIVADLPQLLNLLGNYVQLGQLSHHQVKRLDSIPKVESVDKIDNVLCVGDQCCKVQDSLILTLIDFLRDSALCDSRFSWLKPY